ncbi:MAG TPA: CocE/NonD family hydrolase [Phycisphaerae bacterium]|nr:CocE/NonD family hydrolase [Phycisphaerae bacterium]HNU45030.1 CocE/NonD family hydrolase [Phycisphaerae bacterium]
MANRPQYGVKVRLDVKCPLPDGVRLSTDVYLPDAAGPWPCVLIRTPYNNNDPVKKIPLGRAFAANGYAVAIQDVRGRYDSEGEWEPFFHEHDDGLAAQAWLAGQAFCNGNIALMGRSYEGYCVWMGAFGHHPAVKAIIPVVALPDPVVNVPWQNGSVFWSMITWAVLVHGRTNQDVGQYNWEALYKFRPLNRLDEQLGFVSKPWRAWLEHPTKDDYWQRACYMHRMAELDVPALHICGWYDDDGASTYNNFPNARRLARSRDEQYALIGPWPHATNTKTVVPGVDFGPQEVIDINGFILDWLDKQIGGRPENWGGRPRAHLFVMGSNTWHDFDDWPPPGTQATPFYLGSQGRANSLLGDGALSPQAPRGEQDSYDEYTYDPDDPTPYLYDAGTLQVGGPFDARPVERRDDVLCYTTAPLKEDMVLCGRVFAELWVSSSAEDTEFCAKLCDVHPHGLARQLCDGNLRLAVRNSLERAEPVKPGRIVQVKIDMWATSIRVYKGHCLRLEVASAAVPKLAAHTNTLETPGSATRVVVARNRVYHDAQHASCVLLPVAPGS